MSAPYVAYFDGHCNVCNGFVDYCLRHDRARVLNFAPLQGKTARVRLPAEFITEMSTMVLQNGEEIETQSTAAIHTLALLGGVHVFMYPFLLAPRFIRDFIYRWVANHRYLFAGRRETCRVPTPQESDRLLP